MAADKRGEENTLLFVKQLNGFLNKARIQNEMCDRRPSSADPEYRTLFDSSLPLADTGCYGR